MEENETDVLVDQQPNLLEQLAAVRAETADDHETFITIPGYESSGITLMAKYRLLSGQEVERIAKKAMGKNRKRNFEVGLQAAMDTMAHACVGIYIQRDEDPEPVPLTLGGDPILNYGDPKLKEGLKLTDFANTTRKVIIEVFCNNELAVMNHSIKLQRWFGNTNSELDDEFLGEG